jgi:hypothetical protein
MAPPFENLRDDGGGIGSIDEKKKRSSSCRLQKKGRQMVVSQKKGRQLFVAAKMAPPLSNFLGTPLKHSPRFGIQTGRKKIRN